MNQTHPRCVQCGENPRIMFERYEGPATYHPLCVECHLLYEKSQREAGLSGVRGLENPQKKLGLFEGFVHRSRYFALGLAACSAIQLPLMFLNGRFSVVVLHSIVVAIYGPWAAAGFWLNRRKP